MPGRPAYFDFPSIFESAKINNNDMNTTTIYDAFRLLPKLQSSEQEGLSLKGGMGNQGIAESGNRGTGESGKAGEH